MAHIAPNIFESAVVASYFVKSDGTPVKFEAANDRVREPRESGYVTAIISFGPALKAEYVYPMSNQNASNDKLIIAPIVKKK